MRACLDVLAAMGIKAWRQNSGFLKNDKGQLIRMGPAGAADITGVLPTGLRLEVECKQPGQQPTPEQWRWLREIEVNGGVALVVHSAVELKARLEQIRARQ